MNTKDSFRCMSIAILSAGVVSAVLASGLYATPIILNNSFESPDAGTPSGNYHEGTPPSSWTYVGPGGNQGGGYLGNGSAYSNTPAPDGTQAPLLKQAGGVSQVLSGFVPGYHYDINFYAEGRSGGNVDGGGPAPFQVLIDGTPLTFSGNSTLSPASGGYTFYTSDVFTAGSATPTLEFNATGTKDVSTFVDNVNVTFVSPEPSSFILGGLGVAGLFLAARRRRKA